VWRLVHVGRLVLQAAVMSNLNQAHESRLSVSSPVRAPRWLLALSSCLLIAQGSCGGDDNKGPSPQQQCEALAEDTCDKLLTCASELSGERLTEADRRDCLDSIKAEADCNQAVSVTDNYTECVDTIQDAECEDVFSVNADGELEANELPPVCSGVIRTK